MKRPLLTALVMVLAVLGAFVAPATAQDGPSITVEPATVDAPGEYEFTVTGEGWTAAPPIFVVPCAAPESGEAADVDADTCDAANLTPGTPEDGSFEVTVTYEVTEGGIAIAATDAAQTEVAAAVVTVGAAEGEDGEAEGEDGEEAGEAEGEEAGEAEGEEAGEAEGEEELANTGVESGLIAIVAVAILAAGAMTVGYTRRFS